MALSQWQAGDCQSVMTFCVALKSVQLAACSSALLVICSCVPLEGRRELAERCARSTFPYDSFTTLYHDVEVDGQPAGREHYEDCIRIITEELHDDFSSDELRQIYTFYESRLGRKLLSQGLESKAWTAIASKETNDSYWTCTEHPEIITTKEMQCPVCQRDLVQWQDESDERP